MGFPFTLSFKSAPPGLRHLLARLSQNQGESAEQVRRRFYRRVFSILWVTRLSPCIEVPTMEVSMASFCHRVVIRTSEVSLLGEGVKPLSDWFCGKNM